MSKDTCIKANTYCPVHKGIVGADCWHDSKDFSVPRTDWKQVDEITTLREQVEKLTKERDALVNAIDNEMVVAHMGVFNLGDDPKVALNKICCYAQDLGKFFAEDACKEQLAALAEQNAKLTKERDALRSRRCEVCGYLEHEREHTGCLREQLAALAEQNAKMRKALTKWRYLDGSYNWRCGHWGNEVEDGHKEGCALSLPDLASPVLNRIRAEGMNQAAKWFNDNVDNRTDTWQAQELRRMAAELEKTNG